MDRRRLPNRRSCETFRFEFGGLRWYATVGRFSNGNIAEVFLTAAKTGSLALAMAKDCGVLTSIALQHGATLQELRSALARDGQGCAGSPLGFALDLADKE